MTYVYHRIVKADWQKTLSYYSPHDLTQPCTKCGLNVFLDLEDHYFQGDYLYQSKSGLTGMQEFYNDYLHTFCKGRSRPNRPSATPRQKQ